MRRYSASIMSCCTRRRYWTSDCRTRVTRRVRISTKYTTKDGKRRKYLLLHALLLGRFLPPQHSLRGLPLLLSQAHTHTQTYTRSLPPPFVPSISFSSTSSLQVLNSNLTLQLGRLGSAGPSEKAKRRESRACEEPEEGNGRIAQPEQTHT